jgi:hypothetical protein
MLLRDSFGPWTEEVRKGRCGNQLISLAPGDCGDIQFYLIEIKFDDVRDKDS